jgi:hypothetical protein
MLKRFRPAGIPLSYYALSLQFNGTGSTDLVRITSDIVSGTTKGCTIKRAGRNYIYIDGGSIIEELTICPEP